jgi:hypothetical protein
MQFNCDMMLGKCTRQQIHDQTLFLEDWSPFTCLAWLNLVTGSYSKGGGASSMCSVSKLNARGALLVTSVVPPKVSLLTV